MGTSCRSMNCRHHSLACNVQTYNTWRFTFMPLYTSMVCCWSSFPLCFMSVCCSHIPMECFANQLLPSRAMINMKDLVLSWFMSCHWCLGSITRSSCSWTTFTAHITTRQSSGLAWYSSCWKRWCVVRTLGPSFALLKKKESYTLVKFI